MTVETEGMRIPGVPASISRKHYLELIAATGLDIKNLVSLEFRTDGIYATTFVRDADGNTGVDPLGNEVLRHRVYIPVVDPP